MSRLNFVWRIGEGGGGKGGGKKRSEEKRLTSIPTFKTRFPSPPEKKKTEPRTKGTGSVVNGYESMAGVINLEIIKPLDGPRFYMNLYGNKFSRAEINLHGSQIFSIKVNKY